MLEYESEILLNVIQEDQLTIVGKGIPLHLALVNIFKTYASETNLVFVISANPNEEKYFIEKLESDKVMSITSDYSASERKTIYARGGVFFVTSRIMVVDFLKEVVPFDKISGLIVLRAHNVIDNSQEAFILRLFRSKNKGGFIKAFSQSPASFLLGFSKLNRVMRCCFLSNVNLWPRFHVAVKQSLASAPQDVEEIQLNMTGLMQEIQTNLLDMINWSISELKRLIPALSEEDVTAETAITKGFEKIVAAYVDPVWNTISSKSKEILNDIKILRVLLSQLTKSDCVTFYSTLSSFTSKDPVSKSGTVGAEQYQACWNLWLNHSKAAENVIKAARARVFPAKKKSPTTSSVVKDKTFSPETHPKWLALGEILKEVAEHGCQGKEDGMSEAGGLAAQVKTVVFTEDYKTCSVLRDFLSHGSEATMANIAEKCDNIKIDLSQELQSKLDKLQCEGIGVKKYSRKGAKRRRSDDEEESLRATEVQVTLTQIERKYEDVEFLQTPVFLRPVKSLSDAEVFVVPETLDSLRPDVIIIFDPNLDLIRTIEVHRARLAGTQEIKIYFLSFHNSVEEQIYLTSIQREKKAFELLIQEKNTLVVPQEREGRDELNQDLWRDPSKANETVSTSGQSRRNMQTDLNVREVILVDMREFRSELPSLIHKRGIELEPVTIDVGDYVLTPDICVERKSISDLVGSLNSGRLWKQAEAMIRHYKKPVLLVEHEQQAQSVAAGMRYKNELAQIMPKLQLLTLHFPKLRIIWSPGAHYTSELFHELKRGKDQPSGEKALDIQKEAIGINMTSNYNPIAHNFLSKMPGIDSRNVYAILGRCETLDAVSKLSESEINELLENSEASRLLYSGIHSTLLEELSSDASPEKKSKTVDKAKSNFRIGKLKKT